MTNSDRLQEIREQIQKERQRYSSHPTMLMLDALLQLITEQQREIERLKHFADLYEQQNRAKGYRKQERPM